ncbi:hypothetical protein [Flavobacterium sp.]
MKKNIALLLFIFPLLLFGQDKKITMSEIIEKLIESKDSIVEISGYTIVYDDAFLIDSKPFDTNTKKEITNVYFELPVFVELNKEITEYKIKYTNYLNSKFGKKIKFKDNKVDLSEKILRIVNCNTKYDNESYYVLFFNNIILSKLQIEESDFAIVSFSDSDFNTVNINANFSYLSFNRCNFKYKNFKNKELNKFLNFSSITPSSNRENFSIQMDSVNFNNDLLINLANNEHEAEINVVIWNSNFNKDASIIVNQEKSNNNLYINKSSFKDKNTIVGYFNDISINSSSFNVLNMSWGATKENFSFLNSSLNKINAIDFVFPKQTNLTWDNLNDFKFFVLNDDTFANAENQIMINGKNEKIVEDKNRYNDFIYRYKQFLNHYESRGDLESYNGCYTEMKNIQTLRYKYLYEQNKTFDTYFRWQLSRLLNFYTKHGTDPARAITISIYVIIFFGVFYFFFPSDWDITSKSKLFANYKEFVEKNSKGYFMPFLKLVLGIFISLLNAFTLSLNAFTTLGFGNIPTHGFARYVCILQGFIGWFLLSVFTVAVFNQSLN